MKKLKIFLLLIFIFCFAFSIRAQNKCAMDFKKLDLPAGNLIISEIRQAFRNEIEEVPNYQKAYKTFYDYEICLRLALPPDDSVKVTVVAGNNAKKGLIKYLDLKPDSAELRVISAQIELLDGESKKAQSLIDEAINLDNKNFEAYYLRAFINFKTETGLQNVEEAIRLNNNFAPAYALKAEILLNLAGKLASPEQKDYFEQALQSAQKYLQMTPSISRYTNFWSEQVEALKAALKSYDRQQQNLSPATLAPAETNIGLKLKSVSRANYTDLARISGTQGTVRVRIWFGADGQIKNLLVLQSLPFGLNLQAVIAAKQIEFEPATRNGKPYPVIKIVEYTFTLY